MATVSKRDQILDALRELLINDNIRHISVSDIAKKAGIGKGSIYYYFSSKDEILDALIKRTYSGALAFAKELVQRTDLSIFSRLSQITNACIAATQDFLRRSELVKDPASSTERLYDSAYIHQQFMKYSIVDFKDIYTEIIQQEIDKGTINVDSPHKEVPIKVIPVGEVQFGKAISSITTSETKVTIYGSQEVIDKIDTSDSTTVLLVPFKK